MWWIIGGIILIIVIILCIVFKVPIIGEIFEVLIECITGLGD